MKYQSLTALLSILIIVGCVKEKAIIGKCLTGLEVGNPKYFEPITIDHYLSDSSTVIFRIPPNACSSCVNREISLIKEFYKNQSLPLIITSFEKKRDLNMFCRSHNIATINICNRQLPLFESYKETNPYYIKVNESMIIEEVCLVKKNDYSYSKRFLAKNVKNTITSVNFPITSTEIGSIPLGEAKSVKFDIENTGSFPLIIFDVESSCGCTKPTFPKEPILPGKSATIFLRYSANSLGHFIKKVKVFHNGKKSMNIFEINGNVVEK